MVFPSVHALPRISIAQSWGKGGGEHPKHWERIGGATTDFLLGNPRQWIRKPGMTSTARRVANSGGTALSPLFALYPQRPKPLYGTQFGLVTIPSPRHNFFPPALEQASSSLLAYLSPPSPGLRLAHSLACPHPVPDPAEAGALIPNKLAHHHPGAPYSERPCAARPTHPQRDRPPRTPSPATARRRHSTQATGWNVCSPRCLQVRSHDLARRSRRQPRR